MLNRAFALAVAVALLAGCVTTPPSGSPGPGPSASPTAPPTPSPTPRPTPTPAPTPTIVARALVPVTSFRSNATGTDADEVAAVLTARSDRYAAIELVAPEAEAAFAGLRLPSQAASAHLVLAPDAATLRADMAVHRDRLGFLLADDIEPSVRALAWDGSELFGSNPVSLAAWPLQSRFTFPAGAEIPAQASAYDPGASWTLVAGGDILLDRGVALSIRDAGSVDFPFDGGTATITSRCKDCSVFGWDLPNPKRTGNAGALRDLLSGADLAIANFENPAPDAFRFHASGTVFSADPASIEGLANAGIDFVSLGNNHIRDAGAGGLLQTMANLDDWGIAHAGAGANLADARAPALLHAGGVTVAILGYDTIAGGYWATADRAGSAPLTATNVQEDVAAARAAGADLVIVFPHWGTEYDPTPFAGQRNLAHAAIDAGADMVIGNHAHWAAGMEVYEGKPIWYALGNFVFDQTWSEQTMEGITLELTFQGTRLVQVRMRPHLILDRSQPNFLDAASGTVVMGQVFAASKGLLDW